MESFALQSFSLGGGDGRAPIRPLFLGFFPQFAVKVQFFYLAMVIPCGQESRCMFPYSDAPPPKVNQLFLKKFFSDLCGRPPCSE